MRPAAVERTSSARTTALTGLLLLVLALVGCSRDGFEDRTAVVTAGDETVRFDVDSCGLDGTTLFVVGRSDEGEILQAVIGLEADGSSGDPAATGVSVEVGSSTYAAFGPTSWELRDGTGEPPGSIAWSRLRGARIQLAGEAQAVDRYGVPGDGGAADAVRVNLDARCDERDG